MLQIEQRSTSDFGPCDCCGSMSRLVAGLIYRDGDAYAAYQVHWTLGQVASHGATFYVILGYWGEGALPAGRYAVASRCRTDANNWLFGN
jgi:hypothetical protein